MDRFDSEYCEVTYRKEENLVWLRWKKFSSFENYRTPTCFVLSLLQKYPESNFVIDARNGFEDVKEDVEWGFSYLLPAMSKTSCKKIGFLMQEVTEMEDEMNMWEKEFSKYFVVVKEDSEKTLIEKMRL